MTSGYSIPFKTAIVCLFATMFFVARMGTAQTSIRSDFDHASSGFQLEGAHLTVSCGACHSRGVFAGTPRRCADCHEDGGSVTATPRPARHILSTQQCDACHAERSFLPLHRMDHKETVGSCVSCHDNRTAPGKPVDHPPTGNECDSCHLTVAFRPVFINGQVQKLGICPGCRNDVVSMIRDAGNVSASAGCDTCQNDVDRD